MYTLFVHRYGLHMKKVMGQRSGHYLFFETRAQRDRYLELMQKSYESERGYLEIVKADDREFRRDKCKAQKLDGKWWRVALGNIVEFDEANNPKTNY